MCAYAYAGTYRVCVCVCVYVCVCVCLCACYIHTDYKDEHDKSEHDTGGGAVQAEFWRHLRLAAGAGLNFTYRS